MAKRSEADRQRRRDLYDAAAGISRQGEGIRVIAARIDTGTPYDWDTLITAILDAGRRCD